MGVKCQGITRGGDRCSRPALTGKQHCLMHDPGSTELRREASRKGGQNRSAKVRAAKLVPEALSADELVGWLSMLFTSVMSGKIEPKIGTACATLARTLMDIHAVSDLEARLAELEAVATTASDRWRTG